MKTPIQELIEVLKIHRDTAFEKAEHFKSHDVEGMYQWYDFRGQTLNDAISFAELQLEKEKEVMCEFALKYAQADRKEPCETSTQLVFDETFNTKER
jgi:hypothetical protein